MFKIGQRVKVSFDTIKFPAVTLFAQRNADAVIVGTYIVHYDDEIDTENQIFMVEMKTDSFDVAYRIPVRASQIEEI